MKRLIKELEERIFVEIWYDHLKNKLTPMTH